MLIRAICAFVALLPLCAADVHVDVKFAPDAPSLSDTIRMEVAITDVGNSGAEASDLVLRAVNIPPDCVALQSVTSLGTKLILTLDPVKPGRCVVPAFQTRCLHGRTYGCDAKSAETVVRIGTIVANPDQPEIRDHDETPVGFEPRTVIKASSTAQISTLIGLAILIVAAGWATSRAWRARRRNPARLAQRRLKRLLKTSANDLDSSEAFSRMIAIFRDYLDQRLSLGAGSCSSPELIDALRRRSVGHGWVAQLLADFLTSCDRAKFACRPAEAAEFDRAAEDCVTLIQCLDFDITRRLRAGA